MKYIKNLPELELTDIQGRTFVDENQNKLTMNLKTFLLARIVDTKFIDGKQGSSAILFIVETKNQIEKQDINNKYFEFENEQYKALKMATEVPAIEYDARVAHCLAPFIQVVLNATDEK